MNDFVANPFNYLKLPLGDWTQALVTWMVANFRPLFQEIRVPVQILLTHISSALASVPPLVLIAALGLFGWQIAGARAGIVVAVSLLLIGAIGAWSDAMTTLSVVLTAIAISCVVGIPVGIFAGLNDRCDAALRFVLDFMQSIPSFVYLVPVVMLFGIGDVPGVIVTVIYSVSPVIRLTSLGIREVRPEVIEAGHAFGCSPARILFFVRIPLARKTIMAGMNQTVMLALSMAVVSAMIAVGGLGQTVLRGIGQLDIATAMTGGVGIVLVAITIDRLSQGLGRSFRERNMKRWFERGPVGLMQRCLLLFAFRRRPKQSSRQSGHEVI